MTFLDFAAGTSDAMEEKETWRAYLIDDKQVLPRLTSFRLTTLNEVIDEHLAPRCSSITRGCGTSA